MSEKQEIIATKHYFFPKKLIVIIFEGLWSNQVGKGVV